MLKNKKILLGITGGIAAYKAVDLASKLVKEGAIVKTIMTKNACEFISPITVKSITHQSVSTKMFDAEAQIEHISLADWADIVIIAPATANIIGKTANGIADDLLSTTIMASTGPILFVPAMNVHMFENVIVQKNIANLTNSGYYFMEPEIGKLACGYEGKGRFPKVTEIIYYIKTHLNYPRNFVGEKVLVTAGANREKLDPMRFLTNHSSGKMGLSIARAAAIRGADVTLIYGNVVAEIPSYLGKAIFAESAVEMDKMVNLKFSENKTIIMVAAVSDYTPAKAETQKIKKNGNLNLKLIRTKDILAELGKQKKADQVLVGFAAESENIVANARKKLKIKNLDFIVANNLAVAGKNETNVTLIDSQNEQKINGCKFEVAHKILDKIFSK
ncbi:MAG: bifunctional phosphopantothenoylcysteine decarboxylase/phosphopantothenate--cysteine ligase CoaBC [Candidatus Cloacimonetes bacterium]|nr:bifunctional phosphopantothenoylcysteine decarboxylase/phosphopantothenate--cysteine ligase CoaBC [Candidatus Cloacimonadota bacterium]MBT6994839.1 bifunctional phosphopantothenoylcysteine decarboxylase/phosphopantothenate--cysteine ligase CoaBC [Candidatus Cloacimonadota bacterium]MBT7469213.1 bifunctional phosphopantothenoylcysteine decarboxylase/phosphopantothenate--cysteine ligase CoaBC [Candidatus Cloacimonadota bacterium]